MNRLRPEFTCYRELYQFLFHNKSVDGSFIDALTSTSHSNEALIELISFLLDRPTYKTPTGPAASSMAANTVALTPGFRTGEALVAFELLPINVSRSSSVFGPSPLVKFTLSASQINRQGLIDIIRLLRQQYWDSGDQFRNAVLSTPYQIAQHKMSLYPWHLVGIHNIRPMIDAALFSSCFGTAAQENRKDPTTSGGVLGSMPNSSKMGTKAKKGQLDESEAFLGDSLNYWIGSDSPGNFCDLFSLQFMNDIQSFSADEYAVQCGNYVADIAATMIAANDVVGFDGIFGSDAQPIHLLHPTNTLYEQIIGYKPQDQVIPQLPAVVMRRIATGENPRHLRRLFFAYGFQQEINDTENEIQKLEKMIQDLQNLTNDEDQDVMLENFPNPSIESLSSTLDQAQRRLFVYTEMTNGARAMFLYLITRFGLAMFSPVQVAVVFMVATIYNDQEILDIISNWGISAENWLEYSPGLRRMYLDDVDVEETMWFVNESCFGEKKHIYNDPTLSYTLSDIINHIFFMSIWVPGSVFKAVFNWIMVNSYRGNEELYSKVGRECDEINSFFEKNKKMDETNNNDKIPKIQNQHNQKNDTEQSENDIADNINDTTPPLGDNNKNDENSPAEPPIDTITQSPSFTLSLDEPSRLIVSPFLLSVDDFLLPNIAFLTEQQDFQDLTWDKIDNIWLSYAGSSALMDDMMMDTLLKGYDIISMKRSNDDDEENGSNKENNNNHKNGHNNINNNNNNKTNTNLSPSPTNPRHASRELNSLPMHSLLDLLLCDGFSFFPKSHIARIYDVLFKYSLYYDHKTAKDDEIIENNGHTNNPTVPIESLPRTPIHPSQLVSEVLVTYYASPRLYVDTDDSGIDDYYTVLERLMTNHYNLTAFKVTHKSLQSDPSSLLFYITDCVNSISERLPAIRLDIDRNRAKTLQKHVVKLVKAIFSIGIIPLSDPSNSSKPFQDCRNVIIRLIEMLPRAGHLDASEEMMEMYSEMLKNSMQCGLDLTRLIVNCLSGPTIAPVLESFPQIPDIDAVLFDYSQEREGKTCGEDPLDSTSSLTTNTTNNPTSSLATITTHHSTHCLTTNTTTNTTTTKNLPDPASCYTTTKFLFDSTIPLDTDIWQYLQQFDDSVITTAPPVQTNIFSFDRTNQLLRFVDNDANSRLLFPEFYNYVGDEGLIRPLYQLINIDINQTDQEDTDGQKDENDENGNFHSVDEDKNLNNSSPNNNRNSKNGKNSSHKLLQPIFNINSLSAQTQLPLPSFNFTIFPYNDAYAPSCETVLGDAVVLDALEEYGSGDPETFGSSSHSNKNPTSTAKFSNEEKLTALPAWQKILLNSRFLSNLDVTSHTDPIRSSRFILPQHRHGSFGENEVMQHNAQDQGLTGFLMNNFLTLPSTLKIDKFHQNLFIYPDDPSGLEFYRNFSTKSDVSYHIPTKISSHFTAFTSSSPVITTSPSSYLTPLINNQSISISGNSIDGYRNLSVENLQNEYKVEMGHCIAASHLTQPLPPSSPLSPPVLKQVHRSFCYLNRLIDMDSNNPVKEDRVPMLRIFALLRTILGPKRLLFHWYTALLNDPEDSATFASILGASPLGLAILGTVCPNNYAAFYSACQIAVPNPHHFEAVFSFQIMLRYYSAQMMMNLLGTMQNNEDRYFETKELYYEEGTRHGSKSTQKSNDNFHASASNKVISFDQNNMILIEPSKLYSSHPAGYYYPTPGMNCSIRDVLMKYHGWASQRGDIINFLKNREMYFSECFHTNTNPIFSPCQQQLDLMKSRIFDSNAGSVVDIDWEVLLTPSVEGSCLFDLDTQKDGDEGQEEIDDDDDDDTDEYDDYDDEDDHDDNDDVPKQTSTIQLKKKQQSSTHKTTDNKQTPNLDNTTSSQLDSSINSSSPTGSVIEEYQKVVQKTPTWFAWRLISFVNSPTITSLNEPDSDPNTVCPTIGFKPFINQPQVKPHGLQRVFFSKEMIPSDSDRIIDLNHNQMSILNALMSMISEEQLTYGRDAYRQFYVPLCVEVVNMAVPEIPLKYKKWEKFFSSTKSFPSPLQLPYSTFPRYSHVSHNNRSNIGSLNAILLLAQHYHPIPHSVDVNKIPPHPIITDPCYLDTAPRSFILTQKELEQRYREEMRQKNCKWPEEYLRARHLPHNIAYRQFSLHAQTLDINSNIFDLYIYQCQGTPWSADTALMRTAVDSVMTSIVSPEQQAFYQEQGMILYYGLGAAQSVFYDIPPLRDQCKKNLALMYCEEMVREREEIEERKKKRVKNSLLALTAGLVIAALGGMTYWLSSSPPNSGTLKDGGDDKDIDNNKVSNQQ